MEESLQIQDISSENVLEPNTQNAEVLGKAFWNMMNLYNLGRKEQAILLGMNVHNRASLIAYEKKKSIPEDPDKFLRVSFLLGIHKNLRILYPQNRSVVYNWMTTRQELFHNKTPMEFIAENPAQSLLNLATVRRALDVLRVSF